MHGPRTEKAKDIAGTRFATDATEVGARSEADVVSLRAEIAAMVEARSQSDVLNHATRANDLLTALSRTLGALHGQHGLAGAFITQTKRDFHSLEDRARTYERALRLAQDGLVKAHDAFVRSVTGSPTLTTQDVMAALVHVENGEAAVRAALAGAENPDAGRIRDIPLTNVHAQLESAKRLVEDMALDANQEDRELLVVSIKQHIDTAFREHEVVLQKLLARLHDAGTVAIAGRVARLERELVDQRGRAEELSRALTSANDAKHTADRDRDVLTSAIRGYRITGAGRDTVDDCVALAEAQRLSSIRLRQVLVTHGIADRDATLPLAKLTEMLDGSLIEARSKVAALADLAKSAEAARALVQEALDDVRAEIEDAERANCETPSADGEYRTRASAEYVRGRWCIELRGAPFILDAFAKAEERGEGLHLGSIEYASGDGCGGGEDGPAAITIVEGFRGKDEGRPVRAARGAATITPVSEKCPLTPERMAEIRRGHRTGDHVLFERGWHDDQDPCTSDAPVDPIRAVWLSPYRPGRGVVHEFYGERGENGTYLVQSEAGVRWWVAARDVYRDMAEPAPVVVPPNTSGVVGVAR
jgi:hypothetical protein